MTEFYSCAIWVLGVVAFYAAVSRGFFAVTDSARQSMIDNAGALLDNDKVPDVEKRRIKMSLDGVHSGWSAWKLAFMAVRILVTAPFSAIGSAAEPDGIPGHLRREHEKFINRWLIATLGNSVLATTVFATAMVLSAAISLPVHVFTHALAHHGHHHGGGRAAV